MPDRPSARCATCGHSSTAHRWEPNGLGGCLWCDCIAYREPEPWPPLPDDVRLALDDVAMAAEMDATMWRDDLTPNEVAMAADGGTRMRASEREWQGNPGRRRGLPIMPQYPEPPGDDGRLVGAAVMRVLMVGQVDAEGRHRVILVGEADTEKSCVWFVRTDPPQPGDRFVVKVERL